MKKFITIIVCCVVLYGGYRFWYSTSTNAVDASNNSRIIVSIPKGASTNEIADQLKEKDLISSTLAFKLYVKKSGNAGKLQAGSFVLTRSMDAAAIVDALMSGKTAESAITIPEGYTVKDIDTLLAEKGLIETGEFTKCAQECDFSAFNFLPAVGGLAKRGGQVEGYLFPDTYFVATESFDVESFIKRMLSTFDMRIMDEYSGSDFIRNKGIGMQEVIIMASLIEEETRTDEERPVVSGILWKRYNEGIGLGVDAAVRYIINKPTAAITASDLAVDSPYNLRKYRDLPPGPITNPGIHSIEAALNPKESPYYYYLHGNDGQIRYAVTNDEHNENKAKYLR